MVTPKGDKGSGVWDLEWLLPGHCTFVLWGIFYIYLFIRWGWGHARGQRTPFGSQFSFFHLSDIGTELILAN